MATAKGQSKDEVNVIADDDGNDGEVNLSNISTCPCNCKSVETDIEGIKLDIVILQNRIESSNTKNTKFSEELSKLQLELKKEQHKSHIFEERAKALEEERDSLRLALKLLMQDVNKHVATDATKQENCWKSVVGTGKSNKFNENNPALTSKKRTSTSQLTTKRRSATMTNGDGNEETNSTWCHANDFGILEDLNESCEVLEQRQTINKKSTSKIKHNKTEKNRRTVVVGDSMVKGLHQHKLTKATKQNVGVKCFPGSTVGDMSDYIKPVLRRKPDSIILHVGTNDTTTKKATDVMSDINKLCQEIKKAAPDVEIILSELINREDNKIAKHTINEVNKLLANYCVANNLSLLTHNNITSTSLNRSLLHLNKYGSSLLAKNIVKSLQHF